MVRPEFLEVDCNVISGLNCFNAATYLLGGIGWPLAQLSPKATSPSFLLTTLVPLIRKAPSSYLNGF